MKINFYTNYLRILTLVVWLLSFNAVTLSAQTPSAGFTVSAVQGCAPFSVNFTNTSTGASTYQWIFGNGNFSTLQNPNNVYVNPGTYSVSLIAIAANGQRDTLTQSNYLTALPGPIVHFTVSSNDGCIEQTPFTFSNQSTGAVSYFWDFDDGTSSLQANPVKTYSQPDDYNVSLMATNSIGCNTVYNLPQTIVVHDLPTAAFTANSTVTCDPANPFVFTPEQTNASSYLWNFGDGTTSTQVSPTKTFSTPGIYTVSLYITNSFGCVDTLIRSNYVTVHTPVSPQISCNTTSGCAPLSNAFTTNITNATSYAWNLGNGQTSSISNPLGNFTVAGTYSPSLTVTMANGCSYTTTSNNLITVYALPNTQFTLTNTTGCAPLTVQTNNTTTGAISYSWEFWDAPSSTQFQPSHTYLNTGIYSVRLTATSSNGCTNSLLLSSSVNVAGPIAQFSATDTMGCPPFTAQFTSTSIGATSYLWQFGDGTTSTQTNPVHIYQQLGEYDVTLIVSSGVGCHDTLLLNDYIDVNYEQANYLPPPAISGCAPFGTSFAINPQPGVSYLWDFDDGTTSTLSNPTHVFTEPGTYVVSLLVNDGTPCSTIYPNYQTIIVEGVLPSFMVEIDVCPPFAVTFTDTSSDAVSWLWDFGDRTTSTDESPEHIFPNTNTHHVSLTTTTASGCVYSYIGFNSVNFESSSATFTTSYVPGPFPQTVQFNSTNPAAIGWTWNFGDGTTSTEENPVHIYETEGDYLVYLTIETPECNLSSSGPAFQAEAVAIDQDTSSGGSFPNESEILVEPLRGCAPINVRFLKQDFTHYVLNWFFGDGSSSNQQNPDHLYTTPGIYTVFYVAQTPYGIDTFHYQQSILLGGGMPDFTMDQESYCDYSQIDVSPVNPDVFESIHWTYGDGGSDSTFQASHQFLNGNTAYTILMNAVDTLGCRSSRLKSVQLSPQSPLITYPLSVCHDTVDFTNNMASLPGYSFLWDFGDSTTSTEATPHHYYTQQGVFDITITVTHPSGCVITTQLNHSITVAIPELGWTINGPQEGCAPLTTTFVSSGNGGVAWFWTDGTYSLGSWNGTAYTGPVTKTFATPGVYGFTQRIYSSLINGCYYQENFPDEIVVHGASADFSFTQSGLCVPFTAQFTDLSPDAVSWLWDFGNGITSTAQNPLMNFTTMPGDSVTLTITNAFGCTAQIKKLGLARFQAQASAAYVGACNPLPVQFSASMDDNIDWQWHFGDGSTGTGSNPSHTYTQNGNFDAYVVVTSSANCRDTAHLVVPINVIGPIAHFSSPTPANCAPSVVEFVDSSSNAVSWLWDFGDGTQATVPDPAKLYDSPGVYDIQLMVSDANGCSDTLMRLEYVTVLGPATTFTASASSSCVGAVIHFTDLSNSAVEWEWNFGEGSVSHVQNPTFTYSEEGNYVVTLFSQDTLGCSAFYSLTAPIGIHPYPVADFTVSDSLGCAPLGVNMINQTTGATSYSWNLGGISTSTDFEPEISFNNAGVYNIDLIATNDFGCADTAHFNGIESFLVPIAGFTINQAEGCTPVSVSFDNTSYQLDNPSYQWTFGNGQTSASTDPTQVYFDPGFYSVGLTVINHNGCADTLLLPQLIQVFDTLPAPVTPISRVTVVDPSTVLIEWQESLAEDFGSYLLYRKNLQTGFFDLIANITDSHVLTYTDNSLNTLDNVYCYKLETSDRCGYSIEADSLIEHCTINVEVITRMDNTIDVNWTPYVGKLPSQYRIYRTEESTNLTEDLGTVPGDVTTYNDNTVFCPVKFRYSVKAEALNGQTHIDSDSDYDMSEPIANLFVDQQVNASRSTVVQNQFVLTEWSRPAILPNRVSGYKVFRSTDNSSFIQVATIPSEQTYYLDEAVDVDNEKYYYRIMATNACGLEGRYGEFSDNVVLKAEAAGDIFIKLDWTPYIGWGENGVGFYVIEKQNEDGSWEVIQQVQGNVLSTVDEN